MYLFLQNGITLSKGAIYIWGPPSHGNVGQIALDSLISNSKGSAKYLGCIESDYLMPIAGYCNVTGQDLICKPLEVYQLERTNDTSVVYLLQQRAPCLRGSARLFCNQLSTFLNSADVSCSLLMIATGASTVAMPDAALQGDRLFVHVTQPQHVYDSHLTALNSKITELLNKFDSPVNKRVILDASAMRSTVFDSVYNIDRTAATADEDEEDNERINNVSGKARNVYPHGMIFARYYLSDVVSSDCPVIVTGRYCNEGFSNIMDGQIVASTISHTCIVV